MTSSSMRLIVLLIVALPLRYGALRAEEQTAPATTVPSVLRFGDPTRQRPTREPFSRAEFVLTDEDVVVFLGQTDMARMRHDGTCEALLATQFATVRPRFRNMAWEGDTVSEQWRDLNFGSLPRQLRAVGASVVFAQFGQAEIVAARQRDLVVATRAAPVDRHRHVAAASHDKNHLAEFVTAYARLLDEITEVTGRIVLVGPRLFEAPRSAFMPDLRSLNDRVAAYSRAIEQLAAERRLLFVDLVAAATGGELAGRITDNGLHLTPQGQAQVGKSIARQLGVSIIADQELEPIRGAIVEKDRLWFDNWRPMNWSFAFGDRTEQRFGQGVGNHPPLRVELEEFKPLIEQADDRIHRAALNLGHGSPPRPAPALTMAPAGDVDHSAESELASFTIAEGFTVNLFASEADGVVKPLQMCWDDQGRLWVLCAPTYPHIEPGSTPRDYILVCSDTDRDGRADTFHRFAEGLFLPMGLEFAGDGLFVSEGSELIHLRDTDGDGKADERRVILSGFGTADSHQMINSLTWGPGGELWFAQGHHVYSHVETPWGISKLHKSGVWRYRPRTGRLHGYFNLSSAGLNCQGVAYDEWGQIFHNSAAESGGFYTVAGMIPTARARNLMALAPERRNTGIEFIYSSHLPTELQGCVVWGGYMSNDVQVHRFHEDGSGFRATALPNLLASSRLEFRPVNVRVGPDGAIYVCDWYSAVIGHYQASYRDPQRDRTHGRIWRITAQNRPLVEAPHIASKSAGELLDLLRSSEQLTRRHAKRRLFDLPRETALAATDAWLARLDPEDEEYESLLLKVAGIYEAHEEVRPDVLDRLLNARDGRVRAYGTRMIGNWARHLPQPLSLLRDRIHDEHPRVRLEAIVACSYLPRAQAIEVAAMAVDMPRDRYIDYALHQCVDALKPYWYPALAQGELRFDGQTERLQFVLESDGTEDVRSFVRSLAADSRTNNQARERLWALLATVGSSDDLRDALEQTPASRQVLAALVAAATVHKRVPSGELAAPLKRLWHHHEIDVRKQAIRLAGLWRVTSLAADVQQLLEQRDAADDVLAVALVTFAQLAGEEALPLVETTARSRPAAIVQTAAVAALAQLDLGRAAEFAAPRIAHSQNEERTAGLMEPLLHRRHGAAMLATALADRDLSPDAAKLLYRVLSRAGHQEAALVELARRALGVETPPREYSAAFVRRLAEEVVKAGDAARGRQVFLSELVNCQSCHRLDGEGGNIGPDLTVVGAGRTPELLIESVLWPNRQIREGYLAHRVLTSDGQVVTGYKLKETDDELHVRDTSTGTIRRFALSDVDELVEAGSVMPAGLTATLSHEELRDLIRFLLQLGR